MFDIPRLETPRLILRALDPEADWDGYAAMLADSETARFIGGVQSRAQAWRSIATMIGHWAIRGYGMFAVEERASGRFVGRVGPWYPGEWPGYEVGWTIIRDCWGQGYAVEAAAAAMDHAFDRLGWNQVIHIVQPENRPSVRVAEKLGSRLFDRIDSLPGFGVAADIWGQSAADWRARPR